MSEPMTDLRLSTYNWLMECAKKTGITVHFRGETMIVGHGYPEAADPQEEQNRHLPFAILPDEMAALNRFDECVSDGEGYDVPKEMMKRLAEIGLVRRVNGNFYEHTNFGLSVLNGDFDAEPKDQPQPAQLPESDRNLNFLMSTMDAKVWTDEFCKINRASDHGTMMAWFASAIMTGFDEANRRHAKAAQPDDQDERFDEIKTELTHALSSAGHAAKDRIAFALDRLDDIEASLHERIPKLVSQEYFDEVVDALFEIGKKHHAKDLYRQLVIGVVKQVIKPRATT